MNRIWIGQALAIAVFLGCTPASTAEPKVRDAERPRKTRAIKPISAPTEPEPAAAPTISTEDTSSSEDVVITDPFPENLTLHQAEETTISGDRNLRVAHAEENVHHAIVYLHGMCGNPKGADPWINLATKRATVITVRANVPCPDRPGYKWPKEVELIQTRIDAALSRVKELRGGRLKTDRVTLIGYSQGAHRAERLVAAYPERYPDVVLGGPPTEAEPELLESPRSVAILGGELEDTTHMELGHRSLVEAGRRARFFLLPKAHHGGYGPEGRRVMADVFEWLEVAR